MFFFRIPNSGDVTHFLFAVIAAVLHPVYMYFVYIVTNRSQTLYTGVTNDLVRRVWEHKSGEGSAFASKYKCDRLVYYESFHVIDSAIRREKVIKGWTRRKKFELIVGNNPTWRDLIAEFEAGLRPSLPSRTP